MYNDQPVTTLRPGLAALLGMAALAWFLWLGMKPVLIGINSDAAVYVLLADWMSPWRPADIDFGARLFAHYPFPPLYPLLLAMVGGGSAAPRIDYGLGALLQALAVVAAWCWARRAGLGSAGAAVAALSLAITPIALFTVMGVFSEPCYIALSMAALALVAAAAPSPRAWRGAAALLGFAALTRGVGLFAVAALLLSWAWRTRGRHARLVPLLALAPPLLWMGVKALNGWQVSYTNSLLRGGLSAALTRLAEQIPINLHALAYHFVRCFDLLGGRHTALVCAALLVPAALSVATRLRSGKADALYVVLYLLVITVWPYPNDLARFLLILLPLFGASACHGVSLLLASVGRARLAVASRVLVALLLLLVVLPSLLHVTLMIATAANAEERIYTRMSAWYGHDSLAKSRTATAFARRVLDVMATLREQVPRDACVTSTMAETVMLESHRYSRPPAGARESLDKLRAGLAACPYVLLLRATVFPAIDFPYYYPLERVRGELIAISTVALEQRADDATPLAILARYRGHDVPADE